MGAGRVHTEDTQAGRESMEPREDREGSREEREGSPQLMLPPREIPRITLSLKMSLLKKVHIL